MPRRRKAGMAGAAGGGLGMVRRQLQPVLETLRREIARREDELNQLKGEYGRLSDVFGGGGTSGAPARAAEPAPKARVGRRPRRRAKALDWKQVYGSLPARFTLEDLSRHPSAGKRSKAHLYAIVSRWKKEKKITKDASGAYRKTGEAAPKAKRGPKPKAAPAKAGAPKEPAAA